MKQQLRELLITAKIFQFCADIFAVFGIFLFAYIYFANFKDNPFAAFTSPYFIVTVLIPFVPAAVLAYLAARKRKKFNALKIESEKETLKSAP
ncbi:MAG: hypothetical protein WC989_04000 [Micavibrio sp.]